MYNIGEQEQSRRGMSSAVQILSVNRESCKKAMGTDYLYMAITIQKESNGSLMFSVIAAKWCHYEQDKVKSHRQQSSAMYVLAMSSLR